MTFIIKPAQPIDNRLLIAIGGPQSSGKTTSALRLATGITQSTGGKICLIDTENSRALRYAQSFNFNHMAFDPPFSPARYLEAINSAGDAGYGEGDVVIIDSMSHEHEGAGGVLEMHEDFLQKKCGDDFKKREKLKFTAWIKPKQDRTRVIQMGLQRSRAHVILCFRAKEKVAMVKDKDGKMEVVPAGWQPIGGDEYFYEMDITMMLPESAKGKPDWSQQSCRINEYGDGPLKHLLYNTEQISEETGIRIAQISTVKPQEESIEQKTKKMAVKIVRAIQGATESLDLQTIKDEYSEDLKIILAQSASAHQFVMDAYTKAKDTLEGRA